MCCKRRQFHAVIIQQAVWLYLRFTLIFRDVEDLIAERSVEVSHETVCRWVLGFGPPIAGRSRQLWNRPGSRWHLDDMVIQISGRQLYVWQSADDEGAVLEILAQRRRNRSPAARLMPTLLKKQRFASSSITTDTPRPYGAGSSELGLSARHEQGLWENNRAEVSHQPNRGRERQMQRFKSHGSAQLFLSMHSTVCNIFNTQHHLISRQTLRNHRAKATNPRPSVALVG